MSSGSYIRAMIRFALFLSLALASAAPALAAPDEASAKRAKSELRKYCTGDALNFCGDLDSNDPAMKACFKTNRPKLSENCRRAIDAYGQSAGR